MRVYMFVYGGLATSTIQYHTAEVSAFNTTSHRRSNTNFNIEKKRG
jgi:hypothetical protein